MALKITDADGKISKVKFKARLLLCPPLLSEDH